jgi:hypothetical protein
MMRRFIPLVVALALGLSACGGDDKTDTGGAEPAASKETTPAPPIAPLTGLDDPGGVAGARCAVTVKIDNTRATLPKYGVEKADVVYEEVVEGGLTRLAAVFNSQAPEKVGSVRSVRLSDQSIVWPLQGIFAFSGGAPNAEASIETAPAVKLDETRAGDTMFRDSSRRAPYNLYANVSAMYAKCESGAPQPLFKYRPADQPSAGAPVTSATVDFEAGYDVTWTWNATTGGWDRSLQRGPETTPEGTQVSPQNVVVMKVPYTGGDTRPQYYMYGAEAQLVGTGEVQVFTDGKVITGTWTRSAKEQPAQLVDAAGAPILLTPGQTWVEVAQPQYAVNITAPPPPQSTTVPAG